MKKRVIISIIFLFALTSISLAQKMTVKDSDAHVLMEVNDEGDVGSITLPSSGAAPSTTTNKLYNVSGALYWNGSAVGTAGSAGGWTDGGAVVYLTTSTDKVGIGDSSPTHTLDVAGKIAVNDTQVVYLPDQTNFEGTLYLGDGGSSLTHTDESEGWYNTAVGIDALNANSTGSSNTASGYQALYTNTEGVGNTASGHGALYSNTGGTNTAIGARALYSNTTGNSNTAIGINANYYNQAGSNNTVIGSQAGMGTSTHDKSGNVFIGYQAGYNETGSNKLYIENSNSPSPLIGGDFSTDELYFNGKVGIGISSPAFALDVKDSLGINGTRLLYLPDQTDFEGTLYLGDGGGSLSHTGGSDGRFNTAVGIDALNANTTGSYNTASGYNALYWNTSGYDNTASGYGALYYNTTGYDNTASGYGALYYNTTGNYNVCIGDYANFLNQNGSNNTVIGYEAGYGGLYLEDKSGNVFIGYQAGYSEIGSNKLYIENSASSSPLIGGDFSADELYFNGNVGIGTTSPGSKLHVGGPITYATASKSSNYTLTDSDCVLFVATSGGDVTITMPVASSSTIGRKYYIYKTNIANTIYVYGNGSDPIWGTYHMTTQWSLLTIIGYTSTSWIATVQ